MKTSSITLPKSPPQSEKHFYTLLQSQSQIVTLHVDEANIRAKLVCIKSILTPHMEILHKELAYTENIMKKNPHFSTHEGLAHLSPKLAIQIK